MGQLRKAERFGPGGVRANTLLTDFAYHLPPRGVVTPRALSASAIWCRDRAPVACISRIIGTTLAARWLAKVGRTARRDYVMRIFDGRATSIPRPVHIFRCHKIVGEAASPRCCHCCAHQSDEIRAPDSMIVRGAAPDPRARLARIILLPHPMRQSTLPTWQN